MVHSPARPVPTWRAVLIDLVIVIGFVTFGRRTHAEGLTLAGIAGVAAPFLIALVVGWLGSHMWNQPSEPRTGIVIWVTTIALGMVLRRFVFDRSTATAFIIVASLFLGTLLVGWRAVVTRVTRASAAVGSS